MPDPTIPYPINITGTNSDEGATIIIEDLTQKDVSDSEKNRQIDKLDSNQKSSPDLANLRSGYSNGDIIKIKAVGNRISTAYHTVNTSKTGSTKITLTESASDYAGATVSL